MKTEDDIPTPEIRQMWAMLQDKMVPYLAQTIPDELFAAGREQELLHAVCSTIIDRLDADEIPISDELLKLLLRDICSMMPAFHNLSDIYGKIDMLVDTYRNNPARSPNTPDERNQPDQGSANL